MVLADIRNKHQGHKIVLADGCFDMLHEGHRRHLQEARQLGDIFVVALAEDHWVRKGPGLPQQSYAERKQALEALGYVDYVVPCWEQWRIIDDLRPDVYAKGKEYESDLKASDTTIGQVAARLKTYGGCIRFVGDKTMSSSTIANPMRIPPDALQQIEVLRPHQKAILKWVDKLSSLKVAVVGEAITDIYNYVQPLSQSPREQVIASRLLNTWTWDGGVIAVANHLSTYCGVTLISQAEPITKERFIHHEGGRLFSCHSVPDTCTLDPWPRPIKAYDVVIAVDYGHGAFSPAIRRILEAEARFLAVSSQTNSLNAGANPATNWHRADYVVMNEPEAALAEPWPSPIDWPLIAVTRGSNGAALIGRMSGNKWHFPALNR